MANYNITESHTEYVKLGQALPETYAVPDRKNGGRMLVYGAAVMSFLVGDYDYNVSNDIDLSYSYVNEHFHSIINDEIVKNGMTVINISKIELQKEILSFLSLQENWDGYGAIPTLVDCANNVLSIINLMPEYYIGMVDDYYPNSNGTITMVWGDDNIKVLSLEVGKDTMSYYEEINGTPPIFTSRKSIDAINIKELERKVINILS